ncbi:DUF2784 domain-containing protein [Neisseriaceae bacterium JH1-16]|nr:DUF2784 domain-containing protein [Neisseriaceae bacterium JH1-16]
MIARLAVDLVLLIHCGFVLFVVLGGGLVLRWPRLAWLHLPAVGWGALAEFTGWICPLTPLEQWLRDAAGQASYSGGFVEHYLVPLLYPAGLTRSLQLLLGVGVLLINGAVYGWLLYRLRRR